jgi:hypothetical protein
MGIFWRAVAILHFSIEYHQDYLPHLLTLIN